MTTPPSNLRIDPDRLWTSIMETARIGATAKGGINRLALTDLDRQVRDWFTAASREAGCDVIVDAMGNIFARRAGRDNTLPPIAMGSHLDTQPTGGKFDGVIGVLAGLEVLRTLNDAGIETNAPIEVVNWTNEEGSRFAPSMLASGVFAGAFTVEYAYSRRDRDGISFAEALDGIGYRAETPSGGRPISAFFELHIEQGPILEAEGKTIGVVTGVQGMRWYEATVTGSDSHAGATPMRLRRDALLAAARMIQAVNTVARDHAPDAVGTVGLIESRPNSRNVVPGDVFLTIDLRHPDDSVVARMDQQMRAALDGIAADAGVSVAVNCVLDGPAVTFDVQCVDAVERAAAMQGLSARRITSGAGHDAANLSAVAPTAMIFVPCEGGISHNELEKAEPEHVAAGANVLLHAVLETDARLAAGAHAGGN
jgi:beta-ureidopropionase / N-carbamoyl-L-amino-acid hydrolase